MPKFSRRFVVLAICLASLGIVLGATPALSAEEPLHITGFVSQGYLNTSENNYLVPRAKNGTAEFTEAAVMVVARPQDKLRVGIQFLARNFGDVGNDFVSVDWAFGDYRWRDWLGVRLGKVKMPFGFYNEGRDVDMLRTTIFLPQSIYNERMRDFILAYEGVGAYGNFTMGRLGEGDYHVFGGTLNVPDPTSGFWGDVYDSGGVAYEEYLERVISEAEGAPATVRFDENRDQVVSFPWIYGGAVTWDLPLEGLRVGASALQGRFNFQGKARYDAFVDRGDPSVPMEYIPVTLELDLTTRIDHISVLGAEYLRDRWSLAAEYYHEKIGDDKGHGWYVQAGWQISDRLAFGTYYGEARVPADEIEALGLPDYYSWQKDFTLSLRLDLTDRWLFKIEKHFFDGVNLGQARSLAEELSDPAERNWGMFAAKTTFHF